MDAHATSATRHNFRSYMLKWIKRHPQEWECVGPRTYRYKPFEDQGDGGP